MSSSPLVIQTRTAVAKLTPEPVQLNSRFLFWTLPVVQEPFVAISYRNLRRDDRNGTIIKAKPSKRTKKPKKSFGHGYQCTVEMKLQDCNINLKIFQNTGSLQLTGCKKTVAGQEACRILTEHLNHLNRKTHLWRQVTQEFLPDQSCSIPPVLFETITPVMIGFQNFHLCGLKAGWNFGMEIDLSDLAEILRDDYGLVCTYDRGASRRGFCGVKVTLFWNQDRNGQCNHHYHHNTTTTIADDNDDDDDDQKCDCRKIFLTTFRTGSAGMMGGAVTDREIQEIYRFYTRIVYENESRIRVWNRKHELLQQCTFQKLVYCNQKGRIVRIRTLMERKNPS